MGENEEDDIKNFLNDVSLMLKAQSTYPTGGMLDELRWSIPIANAEPIQATGHVDIQPSYHALRQYLGQTSTKYTTYQPQDPPLAEETTISPTRGLNTLLEKAQP